MITVIYYTSNREDEAFEQGIREVLLASIGDIPLISVSQKPIDFGHNICVGDIGVSDYNILVQLLAGCEAAETPLIANAEADCLYPPTGHFNFVPDDIDKVYRNVNLWILARRWGHFRKKAYSLCAQVTGRKYLIGQLRQAMDVGPSFRKDIVHRDSWVPFESKIPCINIKTGNGMRRVTGTRRDTEPEESLPHWGGARGLEKMLFDGH